MIRKISFVISLLSMLLIVAVDLDKLNFYIVSYIALVAGVVVYPTRFNVRNRKDFLVIPVITAVLFSTINLLVLKNYNENLSLINLILATFCLAQYYLSRRFKSSTS